MNGSFSVAVVTETWYNEAANKNSLLKIPNYSALHKINKNLKFKVKDDIDEFNEPVETLSIEFLNKKSRNILITSSTILPKEITNYLRNFAKTC